MSFPVTCPYCGRVNDQHSDVDNSTPAPGDLSICWGCGEIAVFTEDGVRRPTSEEEEEFAGEANIKAAQEAIRNHRTPSEAVESLRGQE